MKNFFKGISWTQIVAGSLAAVTSFLLSAKIGVAGSVIGVAVGSIVSAIASQIYQNVLNESGKKLQDAVPFSGGADEDDDEAATAGVHGNGVTSTNRRGQADIDSQSHGNASTQSTTILYPGGGSASLSSLVASSSNGVDAQDGAHKPDETKAIGRSGEGGDEDRTKAMTSMTGARTASSKDASHEHGKGTDVLASSQLHREQEKHKRTIIIISVVSALLAVGLTAGIISLVTRGQGTDDVARNIISNSKTKDSNKNSGTTDNNTGTGSSTDTGNKKNQSDSSGSSQNSGSDSGKNDSSNSGSNSSNQGNDSSKPGDSSGSTGSGNSSNGSSDNSSNSGNSDSSSSGSGSSSNGNSGSGTSTDPSNPSTDGSSSGSAGSGSNTGGSSGSTGAVTKP